MINKDSLKAKANNLSKELNVSQNVIYNRFFYDAFLSRLAVSVYKERFILKGGLYLSSIFGIDSRSTMDIDFCLRKVSMEKDKIVKMIKEIASIDIGDGVSFEVIGASDIRGDDLYGGFQIVLLAKLDNVRYQFGIDIATGDPIVPMERTYDYKCLVSGVTLPIKAYSLESIVAEKLETVLSRGIANSRSKDYYDLYILNKTQSNNINIEVLKDAYHQTCNYRNFSISKTAARNLTSVISDNQQINKRWIAFGKKVKYADGIAFKDVISSVNEWIDICYK